jgi:hypothetical protein
MTERGGLENTGPTAFGRVDTDGTVFVRTSAGERAVGQVPGVPADEALSFFTRRFEALEIEVSLLERRIATGAFVSRRCRGLDQQVTDCHCRCPRRW